MGTSRLQLDALPSELIAQIASNTDASTLMNLALTNHVLRATCYDAMVFKKMLEISQATRWPNTFVDVDAISVRAGLNAECWARYAIAEHAAVISAHSEASRQASTTLRWLPELLIVLHSGAKTCLDWVYDIRPSEKISDGEEQLLSFCLAFVELAEVEHKASKLLADLQGFEAQAGGSTGECRPIARSHMGLSHVALFQTAQALRQNINMRRSVWPYNNSAIVAHIDAPTFSAADLRSISDAENTLPLPLRSCLHPTIGMQHGEWLKWYILQSQLLLRSRGIWCGYYGYRTSIRDPPMSDIEFLIDNRPEVGISELRAEQCSDGLGTFDIAGDVDWNNLSFNGLKRYKSPYRNHGIKDLCWWWELKMTPFGLIGDWYSNSDRTRPLGKVWLWKAK
jgi:hypothetical protein